MSEIRYSIITEIKKSDKSNVYLASVEGHEYPVIVKEIQHGNIQVFEALKEIDSEYLPKIYHVEKIEDGLLVVEEYVDGELLADHLVLREITEEECIDIAEQICAALEVLHNHKPAIIHRDVKPSNIIVSPNGKVKLIDYDSSRLYKEESESDTWLLGTENYAAPEQFGYSQTDCRSDIYSLGVVLRRFKEFLKPAVIKKWEKIVEKCTLFSPDSRYQHVSEVKDKIRKIRKSSGAKYKMGIAVFVILLILVVPVIVYLITRKDRQSTTLLQSTTSTIERLTTEISTKETTTTVETPTTELETTEELTTEASTTEAPTTEPPTTEIPTTEAPTTEVSTMETPTTEVPTTEIPTTEIPNIEKPTTSGVTLPDVSVTIEGFEPPLPENTYIEPVYRQGDTDTETIIALKQQIIDTGAVIEYHIKDRMQERNFIIQIPGIEDDAVINIKLKHEGNGAIYNVSEEYYYKLNNIIVISNDYMNCLEDGYYSLRAEVCNSEVATYCAIVYVYVVESEVYMSVANNTSELVQNSTLKYKEGTDEKIYIAFKNCINEELKYVDIGSDPEDDPFGSVGYNPMEKLINNSMCRILENGRIVELSGEGVYHYTGTGMFNFVTRNDIIEIIKVCKE